MHALRHSPIHEHLPMTTAAPEQLHLRVREDLITRRLEITLRGMEHPLDTLAKYTGVLPVAGGNTLNLGGDHREIHVHIDGGPDAAKRGQGGGDGA